MDSPTPWNRVGELVHDAASPKIAVATATVLAALLGTMGQLPAAAGVSTLGLDESAIAIDMESLIPPDRGHTSSASQRLRFELRVPDDYVLSDLRGQLQVSIQERDSGAWTALAFSLEPLDDVTAVVLTDAASLVEGALYTVSVVLDATGTPGPIGRWSFRHLPFVAEATWAVIDPSPGARGTDDTWTFLPVLISGPFDVSMGRLLHSGWGPVGQIIAIDSAIVSYVLDGQRHETPISAYESTEVTIYSDVHAAVEQDLTQFTVAGQTNHLEPIVLRLPPGAEDAHISMPRVETEPYFFSED